MTAMRAAIAGAAALAVAAGAYLELEALRGPPARVADPAPAPDSGTPGAAGPATLAASASPPPPAATAPTAPPAPRPAAPPRETSVEKRARLDRLTREYLDALKVPADVLEAARGLGVGDESLRAMYGAEMWLHYLGQTPDDPDVREAVDRALAALAARGDEGFLAVAANAIGNPQNASRVDAMAKATWKPGLEARLLDWLKKSPADRTVTAPLRALGGIDAPDVHEALADALKTYRGHASNFAGAVSALADLHDATGAAAVGERLREPTWVGLQPSLLDSLGRMGGEEPKRVLVEFVRDAEPGGKADALAALSRFDAAAARAEAEALLAPGAAHPLAPAEAARVRRLLDR